MKKSKIENLLYSKGYVSIEALIVAGLIIATGAFLTSKLVWKGKDVANSNNNNISNAVMMLDNNSFNNSGTTPSEKESSSSIIKTPSNLSDYNYSVIDDDYINSELQKIDDIIKHRSSKAEFLPDKFVEDVIKGPIKQLRDFKGNIILTGYHGNNSDLELPSCINGKTVVAIAPGAFASKDYKAPSVKLPSIPFDYGEPFSPKPPKGNIKSVKIPNTIKIIGDRAFTYNQLSEVSIPDSVTYIGENTFEENELKSVIIPNGVKIIEARAFFGNKLTSLTIPNSITSIQSDAFAQNPLTSVTIPKDFYYGSNFYFDNSSDITFKIIK
ncbi:leucine-rich repeat domain-containing protein [Clostridium perfringens]